MKKYIAGLLALLLALSFVLPLSGCTSQPVPSGGDTDASARSIKIVCTIFPAYDWVRTILGDAASDAELVLLGGGVDLHSYQASAEDMLQIADCDLFLYVGGECDEWTQDAQENPAVRDRIALPLLEMIGDRAREEELVEGMEEEEGGEDENETEEPEFDEHVWLSLTNAKLCCEAIEEALEMLDASHSEEYRENLAAFEVQLDELDAAFREAASSGRVQTLLFADRFPFRYFTDDYDLSYYAAFPGCSAETEASFDTIIFLAEKANELDLTALCTIEGSDGSIAEAVNRASGEEGRAILVWDSMQSVTASDVANGKTYLESMNHNLQALKEALQ